MHFSSLPPETGYLEVSGNTYTGGTITGQRYDTALCGVINTGGAGPTISLEALLVQTRRLDGEVLAE